ncbi:TNF receptor-associated factor family protein DDB_G0272098 [Lucilia cuprina]|uniref:TNF receptor-associated factor family protein DDB_G0272098 n=1 Tax=Lucilia cuprina TaxID=7375 RepID=UPI001F05169A|nr:TNF receptor-associated factor family protein DDB_G0272098 [Lucilia cuprina]
MAIPFYEHEEQLQQQHQQPPLAVETDQVDGPIMQSQHQNFNSPHINQNHWNNSTNNEHDSITQEDLMAWKILALAMCKALKDHYQQNMTNATTTTSTSTTAGHATTTASLETSTAVIQILPNGQVKPQWQ